jgi:hypothetical protein
MQIQRTTMTQAVDPTAMRPAAAPAAQPAPAGPQSSIPATAATQESKTELPQSRKHGHAASMPELSPSDRAAIASTTGFDISPTGEVTPDGMPPWSFIMSFIERRHGKSAEGATETAAATAAGATATSGGNGADASVDVRV